MKRTDNITYKFQGEIINLEEFMMLLCESIKNIFELEIGKS